MSLFTGDSPNIKISSGENNPEGANIGNAGDIYFRNNNQVGEIWQKSGGGNTGWVQVGSGGGGIVTGANNGLSLNGTTAYLGGTLLQNTVVNQNGFNLNFSDATRNNFIINGDVTIPTIGTVPLAALVNNDGTDFYIATPGSLLWIDQIGGIKSATVAVSPIDVGVGYQATATQRNQFFANDVSSELEMGDTTYGSTVSLAAMSLRNEGAGVYATYNLVRSNYTSDQDYDTTYARMAQTEFSVSILEPTVAGVVGVPVNKLTLDSTDLVISSYPSGRDDSGTFFPTSFIYTGAGGEFYESPLSTIGYNFDSNTNILTLSADTVVISNTVIDSQIWNSATGFLYKGNGFIAQDYTSGAQYIAASISPGGDDAVFSGGDVLGFGNNTLLTVDDALETITLDATHVKPILTAYANNAAAIVGGLGVGDLYYTNVAGDGIVKIVI